jgi:hypothetical protein
VHILGGIGGIGKGTIMAELAAQLSTGTGRLPDGTPAPFVKTLFVLSEDAPDDTLKPRLELHGADMRAIAHVAAVCYPDRGNGLLSLRDHLPLLESEIIGHGFGLVVVDALSDFMAGADRNSEGEVRDILTPLADMARRTGVAILGVMHPGKGNADLKGFQRLLGASAFGNVARCVWLAAESPDGEGMNLLGVDKSNLAVKPPTLEWSRREDQPIVWHGPSAYAIGDAFGGNSAARKVDDAEGFLRELLRGGSVPKGRVLALGQAAGHKEHTIRRAAETLRVESYRPPGQKNPPWYWKLPNGTPPSDDLSSPRDTPLDKSSSRQDSERLVQHQETWTTREKPQNDGKMPTDGGGGQVVEDSADDLSTMERLDDLSNGESKGVDKSSNGQHDPDDPEAERRCRDCGGPLKGMTSGHQCRNCRGVSAQGKGAARV